MAKEADILADAKEAFQLAVDAESDNRKCALEDLEFARLGKQWPDEVVKARGKERPMLTINRMPSFIRQVVNEARQNKPQIKVKPVDSNSDPKTAEIINGLIRNIEYTSNADVAYDTAAEYAVTMGWGYIRVNIDYACDDTFDKDLRIERVSNPFSVYGDPHSTAADSSDWNCAFIVDPMTKDAFEAKYKGAEKVDWEDYAGLEQPWMDGEEVLVAEYWMREEVQKTLLKLSHGEVVTEDEYKQIKDYLDAVGVTVAAERPSRGYKVTQRIMTGAEVLETNEWAGRYIPIIPVYGEEVNVEGKRYFRSLIRDAKDAQRMFNFWRTATTEMVALAPKVPFIGAKGAFDTDFAKWESANTQNHAFLEYDPIQGEPPPQRQQFSGVPAGALQEALNASDDMKSIMGLYDASLGARSNETSGRAIMVRQREGDTSTFHFIDNLSRAIRHTGRVLLDLIPLVYNEERIVRVIGPEGEATPVPVNQPAMQAPQADPNNPSKPSYVPAPAPSMGQQHDPNMVRVFDLTAGKYDLAVESGPNFTTRREEAVAALTELMRAYPPVAPVVGDILVKMMDFPNAEEIAKRLQAIAQNAGQPGADPAQLQKAMQTIQQLQGQLAALKADKTIEGQKVQVDMYEAQTDRAKVANEIMNPQPVQIPAR